jgi:hypothetical protein
MTRRAEVAPAVLNPFRPVAVVELESSEVIAHFLRRGMAEGKRDHFPFEPQHWVTLEGIEQLASVAKANRGVVESVVATTLEKLSSTKLDRVSETEIGATAAADRLGCSRQYLLRLLKGGKFPGRQDASGRWWIAEGNLSKAAS